MHGLIYKITNDVNSYCYIGQTITSLNRRWSEHKQCMNYTNLSNKLYTAMRQIGLEHFKIEVIEEFNTITQEELDSREQYWITYYNSFFNGYNSTKGGTFGCHSMKTIECYTLSGNLYKKYSSVQEASDDLSINYDAIVVCLNNMSQESCGGFQWKYENSNKLIKNFSNSLNFNGKTIYFIQYDLNGNYINHYLNISDACKNSKCLESGIIRCAKKEIQYTGNFIWRYGFLGEEIPKSIIIKKITNTNKGKSKQVIHIIFNKQEILYKSLSEASRKTGYSRNKITHNCDIYPKSTIPNEQFKYKE